MDWESFSLMQEAGAYLPAHLQPWLLWMQGTLFLLPLLFVKYWAPRILLLVQLVNVAVAFAVFVAEGDQVTKLFGLGHLAWLWPLGLLVRDWSRQPGRLYRGFIVIAVATMTVSLVLDVRDLAQWVAGDRGSVLVGVPEGHPLHRPR